MTNPIIPASWDIASRLVEAHPDFRVFETHPGGGGYDCLTIWCDHAKVDINREGSVHVHFSPGGEAIGLIPAERWRNQATLPGGTKSIAGEVLKFAQVKVWSGHSSSPRGLTYRVIARLLAARQHDSKAWDARTQLEDTSGYGGGIRWAVPHPEMRQIPANEVWAITREWQPVSWLWDGWAWTSRGERLNLSARYAAGSTIDALVSVLTARPSKKSAPPLPPLRSPAEEQPVGQWPEQG